MLDIHAIEETIAELEQSSTNFENCRNLASLYIVRDHYTHTSDNVEAELKDILPQYRMYCEVKRKYQFHELTKSAVILAMNDLCDEITEFFHTLYRSTDTQEERDQLEELIKQLEKIF